MASDKFDKEDSEWPALDAAVVCKKIADGRFPKNVRTAKSKDTNGHNGATGYESSKENNEEPLNTNSGAKKKKKQTKILWQPLQIETQPYRKRGTGRYGNESSRSAESNKNRHEYSNGIENGRGNFRNGGQRGRRGRTYFNHRNRRDDESHVPQVSQADGVLINGVTFFPNSLSDTTLKNNIKYQMEYYFSDENLYRDVYLRQRMDNHGFVSLKLFLTFPRIMSLTNDINLIAEALMDSNKLELQGEFVRRVVDPLGWRISNHVHDLIKTAVNGSIKPIGILLDPHVNTVPINEDGIATQCQNGDATDVIHEGEDNTDFVPLTENPSVIPLVNDMTNLHINGTEPFPVSADYETLQFQEQLNGSNYPATTTPPELDIEINGVFMDNTTGNGADYYPTTSSPLEQANGYDYYSDTVYNDIIFYDNNQTGTYYFAKSNVLSNSSLDNSTEEVLQNLSPEPSR